MTRRNLSAAVCAAIAMACSAMSPTAIGAEHEDASPSFANGFADNLALANRAQSHAQYMQIDTPPSSDEGLLHTYMREQGWGGSTLSEYGIRLGGYVELGYSWNFNNPENGDNGFGRVFDDKAQDPRIDQIALYLVRDIPTNSQQFDMGFGLNVIYGSDVRYFQANGANFYGSGFGTSPIQRYPDEQIAIVEAYGLFNIPWGNGLLVKAGKFVTPWGLEHIDPTQNVFYSHSLTYAVAQPQTLTGVMAKYAINEDLWVNAGITLGWDQALEDNNDYPSLLGQVGYKTNGWDFVLSALVGPEREDESGDWRWTINGTAEYQIDRDWSVGFEAVFGFEPSIGTEFRDVESPPGSGNVQRNFLFTGDDSFWTGVVFTNKYRMDDRGMWTINFRAEYFNNSEGGRWFPAELYAATLGVTIVPFVDHKIGKNFSIRPEVRYDYSNDDIYDGGASNGQITASVDAIFKF